MQEERKSMGGALVDVFDAGVTLAKTEIRAVMRQVGRVAKAKGIGAVLLLGATGPLIMGLVFLILAVFYGLMRLGLGAWAAALIIALLSFAVMGALIFLGLKRLGAEVPRDELEGPAPRRGPMTEDERLEAEYQAEQRRKVAEVAYPVSGAAGSSTPGAPRHNASGGLAAGTRDTSDQRENVASAGLPDTGTRANATARGMEQDRQRGVARPGLSTSGFTSGAPGVNASDRGEGIKTPLTEQEGQSRGTELRGSDAGQVRLPVYEAGEDGEPQVYGSGLNKKLDGSETHDAGAGGHSGHDKKPDPNIQHPVVLKDAPGIVVSTTPTFREDMKKEEQG
jgi:hypothetical protein